MDVNKLIKSIPAIPAQVLGGFSAVVSVGALFGFDFIKTPATYIAPIIFSAVFYWLIETKNVIFSAVSGAVMVALAAFSFLADVDYEVTLPIYVSFCAVGWCALWRERRGGSAAVVIFLIAAAAIPYFLGIDNSAGVITAVIASVIFFAQNVPAKTVKINKTFSWSGIAYMLLAVAVILLPAFEITALSDEKQPNEQLGRDVKTWASYKSIGHYGASFSLEQLGFNFSDGTLGGPTSLGRATVFEVETDRPIKLRCKVDNLYRGNSWRKTSPYYNYPYIDWMTGKDFAEIFCTELPAVQVPDGVFVQTEITVTPVQKNIKSLATPVAVGKINFGGNKGSIIYNNLGEVFSTDFIKEPYTITARIPNTGTEKFDKWMAENADTLTESPERTEKIKELYCQYPEKCAPSVAKKAEEVMGSGNSYVRAKRLEKWLASSHNYTLSPEKDYTFSDDFVTNFLESKSGYCVHFATAMTVMLRTQGIPARYVSGYNVKPNEKKTVAVTEESAHAWCEAYFEGVGWVPFEPTASYNPEEEEPGYYEDVQENPLDYDRPEGVAPNPPTVDNPIKNELPVTQAETEAENENAKNGAVYIIFVASAMILMYIYIVGRKIAVQCRCDVKSWHSVECALLACGARRKGDETLSAFARRVCIAEGRFVSCGLAEAAFATECAVYSPFEGDMDANETCLKKIMSVMSAGEKIAFAFLKMFL